MRNDWPVRRTAVKTPLAAAISLAACAAGTSPHEPAPTVAIAPAAVAAPAPPDPSPPPPPVLADATEQEKLAFLSTICRTAVLKGRAGCERCAPFDAPDARPNGRVAVDPPQFWGLRSLSFGSFTRPGAGEAAAVLWGCEAREKNYGGTVLAERAEGGWRMLRYDSGLNPASCRAYRRRDGRDVLVCSWNVEERGQVWSAQVFSYDFSVSTPEDVEKGWKSAVSMRDDSGACWDSAAARRHEGDDCRLRAARGEGRRRSLRGRDTDPGEVERGVREALRGGARGGGPARRA